MNEFYRSEKSIRDILLHAQKDNSHSYEDFQATLRCEGIDCIKPAIAKNEEESFYLCITAALQNDYSFSAKNEEEPSADEVIADRKFWQRLKDFSRKNETDTKNFTVWFFECDASGIVARACNTVGINNPDRKIIFLLKKDKSFYVLNGKERFSKNIDLYFREIKDCFFEYVLPRYIQQNCPLGSEKFADTMEFLNALQNASTLQALQALLGFPSYWTTQLLALNASNPEEIRGSLFREIRLHVVSLVSEKFLAISKHEMTQIEKTVKVKKTSTAAKDLKNDVTFYVEKCSASMSVGNMFVPLGVSADEVGRYLVETAHVLEDINFPKDEKQALRKKSILMESFFRYAEYNNIAIYQWQKDKNKGDYYCINKELPSFSNRRVHLYKKNRQYTLLKEQHIAKGNTDDENLSSRIKDIRKQRLVFSKHILELKNFLKAKVVEGKGKEEAHEPREVNKPKPFQAIALTHLPGLTGKYEAIKADFLKKNCLGCDEIIQQKISYILEYASTYHRSKVAIILRILSELVEGVIASKISITRSRYLLDKLLNDLFFVSRLPAAEQLTLTATLKRLRMGDAKHGLLQRLFQFRLSERDTPGATLSLLKHDELYPIHDVIKEKLVEQCAAQCLVNTGFTKMNATISEDDYSAINGDVYEYLKDKDFSEEIIEAFFSKGYCLDQLSDEIHREEIFLSLEKLQRLEWSYDRYVQYLQELHHKAHLSVKESVELEEAILVAAQFMVNHFFRKTDYLNENECGILTRFFESTLAEKSGSIPSIQAITTEFIHEIIRKHSQIILTENELFLCELITKYFPEEEEEFCFEHVLEKKCAIIRILHDKPCESWYGQLLLLAHENLTEKIVEKSQNANEVKNTLGNIFDMLQTRGEELIWLKCLSYILDKSSVQFSPALISLLFFVSDKTTLFNILTRHRSEDWVHYVWLELVRSQLAYFHEDKNNVLSWVTSLEKNPISNALLQILFYQLNEASRIDKAENIISEAILSETFSLLIEKSSAISPQVFDELRETSFFYWRSILRGGPKSQPKTFISEPPQAERGLNELRTLLGEMNRDSILAITPADTVNNIYIINGPKRTSFEQFLSKDFTAWRKNKNSAWIKDHPLDAIAAICRAVELSHGFYPTSTQLMALLIWIQGGREGRGLGGLVSTGEGKTLIFAMFAIYNVLLGKKVNIVTSSSALVGNDPDAEKREKLFELMGVTSAENCSREAQNDTALRTKAYKADIVYGDLGSFQKDYLLSTYTDTHVLGDRANEVLLVDELDSLLLDKSEHVLYLSHDMPDFRHFKKIYVEILRVIKQNPSLKDMPNGPKIIEAHIISELKNNFLTVPKTLESFVHYRLPTWIKNAFSAQAMSLNDNYILDALSYDEFRHKVCVVDKDTGVEQPQMHWSDGLHQFLELKHQKKLSPESLRSIYISNLAYLSLYEGRLYGLSGTPGGETERQLLSEVYKLDFFEIPRFKARDFKEEAPVLKKTEEEWIQEILNEVAIKKDSRGVLILCENILIAERLEKLLRERYPDQIYPYFKESQKLKFLDEAQQVAVEPGDIIISTNRGGRGTDLPISPTLEANGGLFEILTYVPSNERIEEQDFSRVARKGQPGGGKFIVKTQAKYIEDLKEYRDLVEEKRLAYFKTTVLPALRFEQELLKKFGAFLKHIQGKIKFEYKDSKKVTKEVQRAYIDIQLKSLRDQWALWLDRNAESIQASEEMRESVLKSYQAFEQRMSDCLNKPDDNPHVFVILPNELIHLGKFYAECKEWDRAITCFQKVIEEDPALAEVAHTWKIYVMVCKSKVNYVRDNVVNSELRKNVRAELKKTKLLLEKRIYELSQMIHHSVIPLSSEEIKDKVDAINELSEQLATEKRILNMQLSAVRAGLGMEITEDLIVETLHEDKHKALIKKIAQTVMSNRALVKHFRVSKKVKIEGDGISIETPVGKDKVVLPEALKPFHTKILSVLQEKLNDISKRDVIVNDFVFENAPVEIWDELLRQGVIKPQRINFSSAKPMTRDDIDKKITEMKGELNRVIEEVSRSFECNFPAEVVLKCKDELLKIFKLYGGFTKTLSNFSVAFENLEKYFPSEELPLEMKVFKNIHFDHFLSFELEASKFSPGALMVALFGVLQIIAGIAISLYTSGVGLLVGVILIAEGIGDIAYAIQSGLRRNFTFKDYLKRKGISLACNIGLAMIGGAIAGVFAPGIVFSLAQPSCALLGHLCMDVGFRLLATTVTGFASLGVESVSTKLQEAILMRFSEHLKKTLVEKMNQSPSIDLLKANLKNVYQQLGVSRTNHLVDELLEKIEAAKSFEKGAFAIVSQVAIEVLLQSFRFCDRTSLGSQFILFNVVQLIARTCLESTVDAFRANQLANELIERLAELPSALHQFSTEHCQGQSSNVTSAQAEAAAEQFIRMQQKKLVNEFTTRLVQEILKPRIQMSINRLGLMLSSVVADKIRVGIARNSDASHSNNPGYDDDMEGPENMEGPDIDGAEAAEVVEHHTTAQNFLSMRLGRMFHFHRPVGGHPHQGVPNSFPHHVPNHDAHHVASAHHRDAHHSPMQGHSAYSHRFFSQGPSVNDVGVWIARTCKVISDLIGAELKGLSQYRIACAKLRILELELKAQLQVNKNMEEVEKFRTGVVKQDEKEKNANKIMEVKKAIEKNKKEMELYKIEIKENLISTLKNKAQEKNQDVAYLSQQLDLIEKINATVSIGGGELIALVREACGKFYEAQPEQLMELKKRLDQIEQNDVNSIAQAMRERRVLLQVLENEQRYVAAEYALNK